MKIFPLTTTQHLIPNCLKREGQATYKTNPDLGFSATNETKPKFEFWNLIFILVLVGLVLHETGFFISFYVIKITNGD